jgi:predicted cobalt transporter CbtA
MLTRVMSVGLLAGFLAGLLIALLQQVTTTPLIFLAETYEKQGEAASGPPPAASAAHGHDGGHDRAHGDAWKPMACRASSTRV